MYSLERFVWRNVLIIKLHVDIVHLVGYYKTVF